jgi:hypothetical protein
MMFVHPNKEENIEEGKNKKNLFLLELPIDS